MARWTYTLPEDLRARLASAMMSRNVGPVEVWGEVVDWLNANGVERPEAISQDYQFKGSAERDQ